MDGGRRRRLLPLDVRGLQPSPGSLLPTRRCGRGSLSHRRDREGKRGQGAAVLDAGLRRLHNNGVNGCVIDWTDLVDFTASSALRLIGRINSW
ncbi:MAG: hypothetical protein R2854_26760 [Caldilineaceae bacterium]